MSDEIIVHETNSTQTSDMPIRPYYFPQDLPKKNNIEFKFAFRHALLQMVTTLKAWL